MQFVMQRSKKKQQILALMNTHDPIEASFRSNREKPVPPEI
jgi:hypothetical protein